MRAAELLLRAGEVVRGDALALEAIGSTLDAEARTDFWSRFASASPEPSPSAERLLAFVELALRKGDADWALRLARSAVAVTTAPGSTILLALGRALVASGDLTAAALTLEKITGRSEPASAAEALVHARACVELAEARYYASDLAGARASSEDALARLSPWTASVEAASKDVRRRFGEIRLDARNVLGKLLLARGDFTAAERHFAGDAFEASLVQQPVSELRARVNRAIAVMSLGRRAEAQSLLESVLAEGERSSELQAIGITLINLAALAIIDRRYGDALELSERAVEVMRRIGNKVFLARCVANLAELRVRIGLVEEAAQAVRFGARVLRGGPPPVEATRFALVLSRVALFKGDTSSAQRHVSQALAAVGASTVLDAGGRAAAEDVGRGPVAEQISEALRLAARIALDDGDTARAAVMLERAAAERAPQRARAEIAILRALLARALGEPFDLLAAEALRSARDADDDEYAREAHVLVYRSALEGRQLGVARHHLHAAIALRDRVAEGVPASLREAFLQRPDVVELTREAQVLAHHERLFEARLVEGAEAGPLSVASSARGAAAPPSLAPGREGRRIVGDDPAVRALLHAIRKIGPSDATVLVHGESGTGKELVAEALHYASHRRNGPLVKVNCAALVETLLLSELFGHEKGAFTGAAARRRGRFEAADGGTLFLDEIGDISPRTQVALLRVLQEKTFERVGGTTAVHANVRVVCATHRNLKAMVARGELREDLYYRLCGVTLEVPALRSRLGDLGLIADAILHRIADERGGSVKRLSAGALAALKAHPWPGNVRELENSLRAASLFAESDVLEVHDFSENVESLRRASDSYDPLVGAPSTLSPPTLRARSHAAAVAASDGAELTKPDAAGAERASSVPPANPSDAAYSKVRGGVSLHDMKRLIERECIVRALADAGGNITKAATLLGMKRPRLSQLVKQYGLSGGDTSDESSEVAVGEEED